MTDLPNAPSARQIDRLLAIMARLRDPEGGCPWDVEQTFRTIAPYTIEEAYEVADAIERDAMDELRGELGDLLFQVVFHARMAEEAGQFDFHDVARGISDKMEDRHPHVFGEATVADAAAQTTAWETRKAAERAAAGSESALDGVPLPLPALTRAEKLGKRAARTGFDWANAEQVLAKVREETEEAAEELEAGRGDRLESEIGDLLFSVVQLARHSGIDPETALRQTNSRFERRFRHLEASLAAEGRRPEDASLTELEALWQVAKTAAGDR